MSLPIKTAVWWSEYIYTIKKRRKLHKSFMRPKRAMFLAEFTLSTKFYAFNFPLMIMYFRSRILCYSHTDALIYIYLLFYFSPRYTSKLANNIEKLGGARYMFLTHMYAWTSTIHNCVVSSCSCHLLLETQGISLITTIQWWCGGSQEVGWAAKMWKNNSYGRCKNCSLYPSIWHDRTA